MTHLTIIPSTKPRWKIIRIGKQLYKPPNIIICFWIHQNCVVHVIFFLMPGIKHRLRPRMIWVECGNDSSEWIIEYKGTHSDLRSKYEIVTFIEERFVFSYWVSFVVKYCPSATDPAGDCWSVPPS